MQVESGVVDQHKRKFIEFLSNADYEEKYSDKIRQSISEKKRFYLNIKY